jgi:hypothetical protein
MVCTAVVLLRSVNVPEKAIVQISSRRLNKGLRKGIPNVAFHHDAWGKCFVV